MYIKTIFVIADLVAALTMIPTVSAADRIRNKFGRWLACTIVAAIIATFANILVALSFDEISAHIAYCVYFASIDWILYFLSGFCMLYTEHDRIMNKWKYFVAFIMFADSLSIFANMIFKHAFYVYESVYSYGSFYLTSFRIPYYIHLTVDYALILIAFFFIIYRIARTYSLYRIKYLIIFSVLLLVVILNIFYMALSLVLDASVIFYAVAGLLIYLSITLFVPKTLMNTAIDRAVDDMNEGLILLDLADNCIYSNDFSRLKFDIDPEGYYMDKEPIATVIRTLHEHDERFGTVVYERYASGPGEWEKEYYNIRYNQLNDKKGRPIGSYFLIEDDTENRYLVNELNEAKNAADSANRAKSNFLASMSHEIRTPLNSVLGMNEMILRSTSDPQLIEYADNIRQSGDTLLSLINDILDFSKIEANKMELFETDYDPHKLLRDCVNSFSQPLEEKHLYLNVECDEDIPTRLRGDMRHINQVLSNIVSNAIKYTREGGITINVSCSRINDKADLVIRVSDTGIGIAPEDIDKLFDAFRRVNEEENATIQGTGLGLAITKELVNLMHGEISVASTPGAGSTFIVSIPQIIVDGTPIGRFVKEPSVGAYRYEESFVAEDANILVVDDVKMNLKLIVALLKKTKVNVKTALGGAEAMDLCRKNKYDLILLDHRMPDPDGVETFNVISREGLNTETPVIMLTANALSGAEEEYLRMGFADYLSKPVRGADLEAKLIKHLPPHKVKKNSKGDNYA